MRTDFGVRRLVAAFDLESAPHNEKRRQVAALQSFAPSRGILRCLLNVATQVILLTTEGCTSRMASNRKQQNQEVKNPFWTTSRIGFSMAVLVLLIAILALYPKKDSENRSADAVAATSSPSGARPRSRMRGRIPLTEFPDDVMSSQIEMTKGKPIKLDQLGGKVVVVNLWATWCGPCRIEIPHLVELSNEFKNKGVEVVGLTTEEKDAADAVAQFVQ